VRKSALIVDDSKSARVVLKRMLEVHELDVATAESAESALLYLNDHRPDVIFMDHLMPGMDGFEAVTAIKKNPDTATIPIMMYTSQEGEVYVGQARALGAVGVLPKAVQPVEVSKVLESLRVIEQRVDREKEAAEAGKKDGGDFPELERFDHDLRELIQDLFDQQRAVIRRDLLDSYEAIALRVADEIRVPDTEQQPPALKTADGAVPQRSQIIIAVMAVIAVVFAWLYWQREQSWRQARAQNATLVAALEQQQSMEVDGALQIERRLSNYQQTMGSRFQTALDAIAWAVNRSARYSFGEFPLDEGRLVLFEGLTEHLLGMGFSGQVVVETHVGNFCMVGGGADGFQLAPAGISAEDCDRLGYDSSEAMDLGLQQSVSFANFVNITEEQTAGQIRYVIVTRGNEEPLIEYPPTATGVSAGSWNDIARANNRVEITLVPEGF
jgi:CheY-like chemotaxis protein